MITGAKEKGFLAIMNVCRTGRLITYLGQNPTERIPRDDHRHGERRSQRRDSPLISEGAVKVNNRVDDSRLTKENVDAAQPQHSHNSIFEKGDNVGGRNVKGFGLTGLVEIRGLHVCVLPAAHTRYQKWCIPCHCQFDR